MSRTDNYSDNNKPNSYPSIMDRISTRSLTSTALESTSTIDGDVGKRKLEPGLFSIRYMEIS